MTSLVWVGAVCTATPGWRGPLDAEVEKPRVYLAKRVLIFMSTPIMASLREMQLYLREKVEEVKQRDQLIDELEAELDEKDLLVRRLYSELDKYRAIVRHCVTSGSTVSPRQYVISKRHDIAAAVKDEISATSHSISPQTASNGLHQQKQQQQQQPGVRSHQSVVSNNARVKRQAISGESSADTDRQLRRQLVRIAKPPA